MRRAMGEIAAELRERLNFSTGGQAARGAAAAHRTQYDMEMMGEIGFCNGIENYSTPSSVGMRGSRRSR